MRRPVRSTILVVAGGTITVHGRVQEDATLASGSVLVLGPIGDDLRVAGGTVEVARAVGGDLVVAGRTVRLGPEVRVGGRVWIAGATTEVAGHLARTLMVAAVRVRVDGEVDGDVTLVGREIEIGPTARLRGHLIYTSLREARIDPAARIEGPITHHRAETAARLARGLRVLLTVVWVGSLLSLMTVGIVLLGLFPGFTRAAARTIPETPWINVGVGGVVLVALPITAIVLMLTLIALPLGLILLALAAVAPLVGYLTTAVWLGELGLRRFRQPAASTGRLILGLVLALLALAVLRLVPVVGLVVSVAALLVGLGAWTRTAYRYYAAAPSGPPSARTSERVSPPAGIAEG